IRRRVLRDLVRLAECFKIAEERRSTSPREEPFQHVQSVDDAVNLVERLSGVFDLAVVAFHYLALLLGISGTLCGIIEVPENRTTRWWGGRKHLPIAVKYLVASSAQSAVAQDADQGIVELLCSSLTVLLEKLRGGKTPRRHNGCKELVKGHHDAPNILRVRRSKVEVSNYSATDKRDNDEHRTG